MQPFPYHVFVCDQTKPDGLPCCHARDSARVIDALRREIGARGLMPKVQLTVTGSMGLCENGPNIVVYPEGAWYSHVRPEDVAELVESHFVNGRPLERLLRKDQEATYTEITTNRDKAIAAMRARAGQIPDWLMETARAFQPSRTLLTALELDVWGQIGEGATALDMAGRLGTNERATEMLLNALVALETLEKRDGRFYNTAVARFLTGVERDAWMHTAHLWITWSNLTECVRRGAPPEHREIVERGEEWTNAFIAAMNRIANERAPLVAQASGAESVGRMLDVGGGSAAYSIAFARTNPNMTAQVFDLAEVLPITQRHINEAGLAERIKTRAGDLRRDFFGEGFDLVLLSSICHMLNEAENLDLLRRCRAAVRPGGRIVIQDFLLEADKTRPKPAALFALNMLVGTRGGSSYSIDEYTQWLNTVGFGVVRLVRLPGPTGLLIGV